MCGIRRCRFGVAKQTFVHWIEHRARVGNPTQVTVNIANNHKAVAWEYDGIVAGAVAAAYLDITGGGVGGNAAATTTPSFAFSTLGAGSIAIGIHASSDIRVTPAEPVSVVGFPFGMPAAGNTGDLCAIWATGFVASDLDLNFNGLPAFLVDCRGRPGQSGSPVLAKRPQGYINAEGVLRLDRAGTRFMGVYSGRLNEESDIGVVWKVEALEQVLAVC